jgi:HEAT repeat protein
MLSRVGGSAAVEVLRELAFDREHHIRLAAGRALAAAKEAWAWEGLLPLVRLGTPRVRIEAIQVLSELKAPQGLRALVDCFQDPDADVRRSAASALQVFGEPAAEALLELVEGANPETRVSILQCLREIGSRRAAPMAAGLLEDPDKYVRAAAVSCLVRVMPQLGRSLLESRMTDPEPWVRRTVCEALGQRGGRDFVPLLVQRLKEDGDVGVRAAAAQALGKCGDAEAAVSLLHVLLAEEDATLLEAVLGALAEVGDARILELLELFVPRRMRSLSRKERVRIQRKASYVAGRIRSRLS